MVNKNERVFFWRHKKMILREINIQEEDNGFGNLIILPEEIVNLEHFLKDYPVLREAIG